MRLGDKVIRVGTADGFYVLRMEPLHRFQCSSGPWHLMLMCPPWRFDITMQSVSVSPKLANMGSVNVTQEQLVQSHSHLNYSPSAHMISQKHDIDQQSWDTVRTGPNTSLALLHGLQKDDTRPEIGPCFFLKGLFTLCHIYLHKGVLCLFGFVLCLTYHRLRNLYNIEL